MHNTLRYLSSLLIAICGFFTCSSFSFGECTKCCDEVCEESCFNICDVLITYKCESDFKRVIEYFTRREDRAGRTILRTDDCCRDGVYFVLCMNCLGFRLPLNSRFELEFIPACVERPVVHKVSWVLDCCGSYTPEVFLGLTGEDYDDYEDATDFLAWKVSLYSPEGKLMASKESFLWRHSCNSNAEPRLERKEGGTKAVEVKDAEDAAGDSENGGQADAKDKAVAKSDSDVSQSVVKPDAAKQ